MGRLNMISLRGLIVPSGGNSTWPLLLMLGLMLGCSGDGSPDDIDRGYEVVEWWTSSSARTRSAFSYSYPEQKPSQLISYIFSPLGASEWPPLEGSGEFSPDEEELIRQSGQPLMPAGIAFSAYTPDPGKGAQIVLTADDVGMILIAEAYLDPLAQPVSRREYALE